MVEIFNLVTGQKHTDYNSKYAWCEVDETKQCFHIKRSEDGELGLPDDDVIATYSMNLFGFIHHCG
jgi:hypothetical protein